MDPDFWWQLWAGEQMHAGQFPYRNALSWTAPTERWVSHEPLVAYVYAQAGLDWLWLVRGLLVSATGITLLHLGWRKDHVLASCVAIVWALFLYKYGISLRALTWGNLLLGICVILLFRSRAAWRLPITVLLIWVWAQVHGSFVLGVFLLLLVDWRWSVLAFMLTAINPNGFELWALIFGYGAGTGSEALVHEFIREWLPLWSAGRSGLIPATALVFAGGLILTGKSHRPKIIFLALAVLAIRHQRYCDVVVMGCLPFVADRLSELLPPRSGASATPYAIGLFTLLAILQSRATPFTPWYPPDLPAMIPAGARLFNDFRLGGFLGWHGVKVFYDSRNDCYPPEVLREGFAIERQEAGWETILSRWSIDHVVTANAALVTALKEQNWEQVAMFNSEDSDFSVITLLRFPSPDNQSTGILDHSSLRSN